MITSFRKFFQSKVGMAIFLLFLGIVALAFIGADVTGTTFGGVTQGERVARVQDDTITTNELSSTAQSALRQVQRQTPGVTMQDFIEEGGLDEVLSQLIDRYAVGAYAEKYGLRAGDNLVNSEILKISAFRGVNGEFDQDTYRRALADQRITDTILRRDLADGLLAQQLLIPALAGAQMPKAAARRYGGLFLERRIGQIALIPSALFTAEEEPGTAAIEAYYSENRKNFIEPERRTLRFAVFGADNIDADVTPTKVEIAQRYEANKDDYAARESRDVTYFTVPTQEGAKAIAAQIRAGKRITDAARDAGFNTTQVADRDNEQFTRSTSFAAAQAVFAAKRGEIAEPAQTSLGWLIARVDGVTTTPARSLADATPEITEALTAEKRTAALGELSARIEAEVDQGTALTEIADQFDLTLEESPPLLADGRVFGDPRTQPNAALRPILETAFGLDESQPQLGVLVPGQQFLIYDVTNITESAAPPLAEIRDRVVRDLKLAEASKRAREVAKRVQDTARGETSLAAAISGERGKRLPPPDDVALSRAEIQQLRSQGQVPPALALLFSMTKGTIKLLEAPANQGWILVALDTIEAGEIEDDSPIIEGTRRQLAETVRSEYSDQLTQAIRNEIKVETNEGAIDTVRKQLLGES